MDRGQHQTTELKSQRIFCGTIALLAILASTPPAQAANNVTYQYDSVGRITQIQRDDGVTFKYAYDANGNRTQQQVITSTLGSTFVPKSGWWWDPGRAGSGVSIEFNAANAGYVGTYLFDALGTTIWYSALGSLANAVFTGGLFQYSGGPCFGSALACR
jgi:YD repeat-containing protein